MITKNTCQTLLSGTTRLCGRKCVSDMCKYHRFRFKNGQKGKFPCIVCGKGVNNKYQRCIHTCGYIREDARDRALAKKNLNNSNNSN